MTSQRPILALSTGDPGGIGPEICLKAALDKDVQRLCRPVLVGDPIAVEAHIKGGGLPGIVDPVNSLADVNGATNHLPLIIRDHFSDAPFQMGAITAQNGIASVDSSVTAIQMALEGDVAAVVAAPNTKSSINRAGIEYDGHLSLVARETGLSQDDIFMMLSFGKVNLAHCTLHSSVRRSLELITRKRVVSVINAVHETLIATGIPAPRIIVSGVNPHASEGGLFGEEEAEIIAPAIEDARAEGIQLEGPVPADLMLHREDVDAFIVMLHDQGHIPAKVMARHGAAGVIIGSPIRFASVGHGSALDIAGQGIANPDAMIEAIRWFFGDTQSP